jgi:hypothetical protein
MEEWKKKNEEEDAAWEELGVNLDQLNYSGSELFMMQCKLQALTNCMIEGDFSAENLNWNLQSIIFESREHIREGIEPQIKELKLKMLQARLTEGVVPPGVPPTIMAPWDKKPGGNGGS